LIDFVHMGYHKTGTSWLQYYRYPIENSWIKPHWCFTKSWL